MIGVNSYKGSPFLLDKLKHVCGLLKQGKKEYEQVATSVDNKDLHSTMLALPRKAIDTLASCRLKYIH